MKMIDVLAFVVGGTSGDVLDSITCRIALTKFFLAKVFILGSMKSSM